jgi:hypothetical protein
LRIQKCVFEHFLQLAKNITVSFSASRKNAKTGANESLQKRKLEAGKRAGIRYWATFVSGGGWGERPREPGLADHAYCGSPGVSPHQSSPLPGIPYRAAQAFFAFLRFFAVFCTGDLFMNNRKIKQTGRSKAKPAFTRLKELSPEKRLAVMEILESHTYKEALPLVEELVGFECSINLLCKFRSWQATELELARNTDLLEQIEKYLRQRKGDWSLERIQDAAISFLMLQALSKGDVKAFATITRLPGRLEQVRLKAERLELDREKFAESQRSKVSAGLDELREKFRENHYANKFYQAARDVLEGRAPKIAPPKPKPEPPEKKEVDKRVYLTRSVYRRKGCGCVCRTCHPENGVYPYAEALKDAAEAKQRGVIAFWRGWTSINTDPKECECPCAEHPAANNPNPVTNLKANVVSPPIEKSTGTASSETETRNTDLSSEALAKEEHATRLTYHSTQLADFARRAALLNRGRYENP